MIDDSPSMRKLVRHMLYQVGLRDHVHDASSADCLPLLRRYRPRLIILSWDIEGPGSSNFVTFIRNPTYSSAARTPILATIDRPTLRNIRTMQAMGIRACLKSLSRCGPCANAWPPWSAWCQPTTPKSSCARAPDWRLRPPSGTGPPIPNRCSSDRAVTAARRLDTRRPSLYKPRRSGRLMSSQERPGSSVGRACD
ncbi:MAG: hypothetical protein ACOYOJ_02090 [Alsobacter sp.]